MLLSAVNPPRSNSLNRGCEAPGGDIVRVLRTSKGEACNRRRVSSKRGRMSAEMMVLLNNSPRTSAAIA